MSRARRLLLRVLRWYGRQPDHTGKLALMYRLAPPGRAYVPPNFIGYYRDDLLVQLDTRNYLEWWVYMFGQYEAANVALLRRVVQPGMVVADVGANVGLFTLLLARSATATGQVHAFEPNPPLFQRLSENVALNRLPNVALFPQACAAVPGDVTFYAPAVTEINQGLGTLRPTATATPITVAATTLDAHFAAAPRLDFIKLDVEGAEALVLQGAEATLRRLRPSLLLEAEAQHGTTLRALLNQLHGLGYHVWSVDNAGLQRVHATAPVGGSWYASPATL